MSTIPTITTSVTPLTRAELAAFLPSKRAIDVFAALTITVPAVVAQSNAAVSQIDQFNFNFDALNADIVTINSEIVDLQSQIDGISVADPGAITGLTDGGVVDNSPTFQSFLGPAELSGSIIAADGVVSHVPQSGAYLAKATVNTDPQISMDWSGRGAIVVVPDAHLPGITPGAAGTIVRTGGGAPGSVYRILRRAPDINKQAYQPIVGGHNIDGTGVKMWDDFTCDSAGTFTSNGHQRINGDMVFFDQNAAGATLPAPLLEGDFTLTSAYYVINATTNTFQVSTTVGGSKVTTAAGAGVWSTNVYGIRFPNNQPGTVLNPINQNDPDQDWNNKKDYTGGRLQNMDIVGMSASGLLEEGGNGRLYIDSVRFLNNRLHGADISSNDKVFGGHWAAGGNGGFGIKTGSGTGIYAWGGNVWGKPTNRSINCGAWFFHDTAYWSIGGTEFNDWVRLDGNNNWNNSGVFVGNMMHPHGENFVSDGLCYNVLNDGDSRLQAAFGQVGYQGVVYIGQSWVRSEKNSFSTPGTLVADGSGVMHGTTDGSTGTALQYLIDIGAGPGGGRGGAMAQIFDGVCTAPDVKPWMGAFAAVTFTNGSTDIAYASHPLSVGDRVYFHGGSLPTGISADTQYYVTNVGSGSTIRVSLTWGGSNVSPTSNGSGTCYWMSAPPYNLHSGGGGAGVYADSYRGHVRTWQKGGVAPKFMFGAPFTPWEGNPSYSGELGTSSATPSRYALFGLWEADNALGYQDAATDIRTGTGGSGAHGVAFARTVKAGTLVQEIVLTTAADFVVTLTLPCGADITNSQPLRVIIKGKPGTLAWAFTNGGGILSGTPTLPTMIPGGGLVVDLWYSHPDGAWVCADYFTDGGAPGRTDNTAVPAGAVGESIISKVTSGSAVSMTSTSVANVTSITLTAGEWDVQGSVINTTNTASATQATRVAGVLSTTSAANFTSTDSTQYAVHTAPTTSVTASGTDIDSIVIGKTRILVPFGSTQQVWLNAKSTFTGGVSAWGSLSARRPD